MPHGSYGPDQGVHILGTFLALANSYWWVNQLTLEEKVAWVGLFTGSGGHRFIPTVSVWKLRGTLLLVCDSSIPTMNSP